MCINQRNKQGLVYWNKIGTIMSFISCVGCDHLLRDPLGDTITCTPTNSAGGLNTNCMYLESSKVRIEYISYLDKIRMIVFRFCGFRVCPKNLEHIFL